MLVSVAAVSLFTGCSGKGGGADMMPKKPAVPSEMGMLSDMIGTWNSTWEISGKMAEEMRKADPNAPLTFKSENTCASYMDGIWLKCEGWYEMGPDLRATYVEYWGYSHDDNAFHSYFISDMGEVGHGTMRSCSDDNRCFKMSWTGHDLNGVKKSGSGCFAFKDRDNMEFSMTEKTSMFGKMEMKGTGTRKK